MSEEILVTDSQELQAVCEYYGLPTEDFTGALVVVGDGEYKSVRLTTDSRPYLIGAEYRPASEWVKFYRPHSEY